MVFVRAYIPLLNRREDREKEKAVIPGCGGLSLKWRRYVNEENPRARHENRRGWGVD